MRRYSRHIVITPYRDLVAAARAEIAEVTPDDAWRRIAAGAIVVDVREPTEYVDGVVPGALLIPRGVLESDLSSRVTGPATPLLLLCAAGNRSLLAAKTLHSMGFSDVASVAGGLTQWKADGLPWNAPKGLSLEQHARYHRHVMLPEVGLEGQQQLLAARVLLVGAGGLGSPVALYLAAAGVGTIVVVDDDLVDASNLQRQVAHASDRVGSPKVDSARRTIRGLNPDVTVEARQERLTAANVLDLMKDADVVVDGADNFPTRYLVNDASLHLQVPVVHGSVLRFEGQVSVFRPYESACYRCLYPEPPHPELAPSCAEAGVLGVLPGVIGTIQAVEALKLILGIGDSLAGRLLAYDALEQSFMTLRLARNPLCPACADETQPPLLVDYDASCRPASTHAG
jgi:molybdopterin/thiamine biosynthesis adenylyltransferase/rhodanese-related sulfurtransferase